MRLPLFFLLIAPCLYAQVSDDAWNQAVGRLAQALRDVGENGWAFPQAEDFETVARDDSERAVALLAKAFAPLEDPLIYAAVQAGVAALESEDALEEARKLARKHRSPKTRIVFLDGLAARGAEEDLAPVIAALDDDERPVQSAALAFLERARTTAAVAPIAEQMADRDRKRGAFWLDCRDTLARLTGVALDSGEAYQAWLAAQSEDFALAAPGTWTPVLEEDDAERFFGHAIERGRIVFILDLSCSMRVPRSVLRDGAPAEVVPLERAKAELIEALERLPSDTHFAIVAYNSLARAWNDDKLVRAKKKAVREAVAWVERLAADGASALDEALRKAFAFDDVEGAYLISDGFPTLDGQNAIPREVLTDEANLAGRYTRPKLHVFGLYERGDGDLEAVAEAVGGFYHRLDE